MTKQKKNGNGQDTVKEKCKKYMITAVAALIVLAVIFLIAILKKDPSSGEQAPSKELLAEQIAADAAIPGSVETVFLKLDGLRRKVGFCDEYATGVYCVLDCCGAGARREITRKPPPQVIFFTKIKTITVDYLPCLSSRTASTTACA